MNIALYGILQDEAQHPTLIREQECAYEEKSLSTPEAITEMLNTVFNADRQCEEHMYMVDLNASNEALGVFDISHGSQTATLVDARSIFTRCLLTGAASFVLAHNHPSGGLDPSRDDIATCERIRDAGRMMGIPLLDFIIIGKRGEYHSFCRDGMCQLKQ